MKCRMWKNTDVPAAIRHMGPSALHNSAVQRQHHTDSSMAQRRFTHAHTHTYNNQGQTSTGTHTSALPTSLTSITFTTQYTLSMGKEEAEIQLQDGHGMVPPWYTILCLTFYFVTGLFHSSEVAAVTRLIGNWFTSQTTAMQSQPSGHRLRLRMSGIGYSTRYLFARSFCRLHTSDSM